MPPKKSSAAKKKKNLGSARGFATVSVPKRVDPTAEEPAAEVDGDATLTGGNNGSAEGADGAGASGGDKVKGAAGAAAAGVSGPNGTAAPAAGDVSSDAKKGDWDDSPEALERKELQELADRIKPGCDKEISRIVKVRQFASVCGIPPSFRADMRDLRYALAHTR